MLVTRQADYAIRIIRALSNNETLSVKKIAELETIPFQFAYKIITKLDKANMVVSFRGANGGYALSCNLKELTLYDILNVIDDSIRINECTGGNDLFECPNNANCGYNREFIRIQKNLISDLKKHSVYDIINMKCN